MKLRLFAVFLFLALFVASVHAIAMVSSSPALNTVNNSRTANITLTFDANVDIATAGDGNIIVFGYSSGRIPGATTYNEGTFTVTFNPTNNLSLAERVDVFVSKQITNTTGTAIDGNSFTFWAAGADQNAGYQHTNTVTFTTPTTTPRGFIATDLNGDLIPDIAFVNSTNNVITVKLNQGLGVLGADINITIPAFSIDLAYFDINSNGKTDLGTTTNGDDNVSLFMGAGDGTFSSPDPAKIHAGDAVALAFADFDLDGNIDIAVADNAGDTIQIALGNRDGTFDANIGYAAGNGPRNIIVADFSNDGYFDVLSMDTGNDGFSVILGDGDGTFGSVITQDLSATILGDLTLGEFNGDGNLDFLLTNYNGANDAVYVYLGDANGSFTAGNTYFTGNFTATQSTSLVEAADLDGNGTMDFISLATSNDVASIWLNDGTGSFTFDQNYSTANDPAAVAIGDFNNDGFLDFAVHSETDNNGMIFFGQASNTAPATVLNTIDSVSTGSLGWFSYNADGNLTIDFNITDDDNDSITFDVNYSTVVTQGTGTVIASGVTLGANECDSTVFSSTNNCTWDWNISSIGDVNYFINILVSDGTDTNYVSFSQLGIDNTAPVTTSDINSVAVPDDANVVLTCTDANSGCATTYYQLDTDSNESVSLGTLTVYTGQLLVSGDGNWAVHYFSTDVADGNETTVIEYVQIDTSAPVIPAENIPTNPAADARVVSLTFAQTVRRGVALPLTAMFTNTGGTDAFNLRADVLLDVNPLLTYPLSTLTAYSFISLLSPNQLVERVFTLDTNALTLGLHDVHVRIFSDQNESNISDNVLSGVFYVNAAASNEVCGNGIDDDRDGLSDVDDPDCREICDDGIDNDGDGFIDESDACFVDLIIEEVTIYQSSPSTDGNGQANFAASSTLPVVFFQSPTNTSVTTRVGSVTPKTPSTVVLRTGSTYNFVGALSNVGGATAPSLTFTLFAGTKKLGEGVYSKPLLPNQVAIVSLNNIALPQDLIGKQLSFSVQTPGESGASLANNTLRLTGKQGLLGSSLDISFTSVLAVGQTKTLTVTAGKIPLEGVTVTISSPNKTSITTKTNAQGLFNFTGTLPGVYSLTFSKEGFESVTVLIQVGKLGFKFYKVLADGSLQEVAFKDLAYLGQGEEIVVEVVNELTGQSVPESNVYIQGPTGLAQSLKADQQGRLRVKADEFGSYTLALSPDELVSSTLRFESVSGAQLVLFGSLSGLNDIVNFFESLGSSLIALLLILTVLAGYLAYLLTEVIYKQGTVSSRELKQRNVVRLAFAAVVFALPFIVGLISRQGYGVVLAAIEIAIILITYYVFKSQQKQRKQKALKVEVK